MQRPQLWRPAPLRCWDCALRCIAGGLTRGWAWLQVYKAVRAGVQDVAVKFLHRTNAEDLQKFIEARVLQHSPAALLSCNPARVHDLKWQSQQRAGPDTGVTCC